MGSTPGRDGTRGHAAAGRRAGPTGAWIVAVLVVTILATLGAALPASAETGRVAYPARTVATWPGLVVGLGDSVPAGNACDCTTYVSLVARTLADGDVRATRVTSLARGGATTWSVLGQLAEPTVRATVAAASVVIVTVGANDFSEEPLSDPSCRPLAALTCYRAALAAQIPRLDQIFSTVVGLTAPSGGVVIVTGYWNIFLDGTVGRRLGSDYVTGTDALTRAFNANVATAARATGARYVDEYTPFKGNGQIDCTPLLAPDGDHPNALGHQVMANAVLAALRDPDAVPVPALG